MAGVRGSWDHSLGPVAPQGLGLSRQGRQQPCGIVGIAGTSWEDCTVILVVADGGRDKC